VYIEVFVDGASRGNGQVGGLGESSCAVVIYKNRKEIVRYARGLGRRTNNEAEYEAVITALLICVMSNFPDPIIYSDSLVVVNQINGKWKCQTDNLLPLLLSVNEIKDNFRFRIQHVSRDLVGEADFLAKKFLDNLAVLKKEYVKNQKGKTGDN